MSPEIAELYGNKVRIRVCGLCWQDDRLLMVKHLIGNQVLWSPPGGGLEFGETLEQALMREMKEETALEVRIGPFAFGCEFIAAPLHAIELFFQVTPISGVLTIGQDPELPVITSVNFLSPDEIDAIPGHMRHGIFNIVSRATDLVKLGGFHRI